MTVRAESRGHVWISHLAIILSLLKAMQSCSPHVTQRIVTPSVYQVPLRREAFGADVFIRD